MGARTLPLFLAMIGVSAASLLALVFREKRAIYPLLPTHLLVQPTIWPSDALAACHGAMRVASVNLLAAALRVARGPGELRTGTGRWGMATAIGYLLAVVGPVTVGILHEATGSWNSALIALFVLLGAQLVVGVLAGRDRQIG